MNQKERKKVERFRALADRMDKEIIIKMNPAVANQNLTPRRARIMAGMRSDGDFLIKVQQALRGIADDIEAGQLPREIINVNSKADIINMLRVDNWPLERYFKPMDPEQIKAQEIRKLEMDLLGTKIPGFFPTPEPVIERMFQLVYPLMNDAKDNYRRVLEPSAGKGDILDLYGTSTADLNCCEINPTLRKILRAKGYQVISDDFFNIKAETHGKFDLIIQNPPFEKGEDIDHVYHAYRLLQPGGVLVSIMSEGPFFREDKKAVNFRSWIDNIIERVYIEKLDPGAFKGKGSFRQTGVNCRILTIKKERLT